MFFYKTRNGGGYVDASQQRVEGRGGKGEPKQERARRTRAQILDMAAELFAERGYPLVTLQDVAARASMTKGAVYFHYKDKEALAIAVVQEHYARWPVILQDATTAGPTPFDRLIAVLDRAMEAFHTDIFIQAGARLQIERALIGADLPQPFVGWHAMLAELATDVRDAGQLRPGITPDAAAQVIVAAFFGVQHVSDVLHRRADIMERYAELRDVLVNGLRADHEAVSDHPWPGNGQPSRGHQPLLNRSGGLASAVRTRLSFLSTVRRRDGLRGWARA